MTLVTTALPADVQPRVDAALAALNVLLEETHGELYRNKYPSINVKDHSWIDPLLSDAQKVWLLTGKDPERNNWWEGDHANEITESVRENWWEWAKDFLPDYDIIKGRISGDHIFSSGRSGGHLIWTEYNKAQLEEMIEEIEEAVSEYVKLASAAEANDDPDDQADLDEDAKDALESLIDALPGDDFMQDVEAWKLYRIEIEGSIEKDALNYSYMNEIRSRMEGDEIECPEIEIIVYNTGVTMEQATAIRDLMPAMIDGTAEACPAPGNYRLRAGLLVAMKQREKDALIQSVKAVVPHAMIRITDGDDEATVLKKMAEL